VEKTFSNGFRCPKNRGKTSQKLGDSPKIGGASFKFGGAFAETGGTVFKNGAVTFEIGGTALKFGAVVLKIGAKADGLRQHKSVCGKRSKIISVIAQRLRVPFWIHRLWQNDKQFLKSRATGI